MVCMKSCQTRDILIAFILLSALSACSADKLEARLQADPQCKALMNPKTGALMPCPGSDKQFYQSMPSAISKTPAPPREPASQLLAIERASPMKPVVAPAECKPSLHQKSGALMPCPGP